VTLLTIYCISFGLCLFSLIGQLFQEPIPEGYAIWKVIAVILAVVLVAAMPGFNTLYVLSRLWSSKE
jgi:FtsH-binding integral membrane protein